MTSFAQTDRDVLNRILHWRRDVRHFRTDPVPPELLDQLHGAMETAPSVGNSRPWRVISVESPDLRTRIRDDFHDCNASAAQIYDTPQRAEYLRLKLAGLDRAPVQLAIFTDINPPEGHGLGRQTIPQTLHQSTAMAIHALWLVARALNLGVGMLSILRPQRVAQILMAPDGWQFSAYLCIGWPEFTDDTPLLHRTGWQQNTDRDWLRR